MWINKFALPFRLFSLKLGDFYQLFPQEILLGDQSRFLNFGYWTTSLCDYDTAAKNLALKLAEYSQVTSQQILLSVGCGFGDENFLWQSTYQLKQTIGLNLYSPHLRGIKQDPAEIAFCQANATLLPFQKNTIDRILALESAFHFDTREMFFKEAFSALKPSGILGLADIVLWSAPLNMRQRWLTRLFCRFAKTPLDNLYTIEVYQEKLATAGYHSIEFINITQKVLKRFWLHVDKVAKKIKVPWFLRLLYVLFRTPLPINYVMVKGVKPA